MMLHSISVACFRPATHLARPTHPAPPQPPAPPAAGGSKSASAYKSGAAPAPAPAPAGTTHYVEAEVQMDGITLAQFDAGAQTAFKETIAAGMDGVKAADVYDVKAVAVRRAGIKVSFKVKVASAAAAMAGATKLSAFLKDTSAGGFLTKLKAKSTKFAGVTKITVTKEPKAKTSTTVSGVAKTAIASVTSFVALAFALCH